MPFKEKSKRIYLVDLLSIPSSGGKMSTRLDEIDFFSSSFFQNLTYSRWTSSLPSSLWSLRIFPSLPGSRLTIFYRDASSAILQLVNQRLNCKYKTSSWHLNGFPIVVVTLGQQYNVCVCVCVFFPSILDIKFVGRTSRGHTGGRSHRIFNPPSFCGACLDFCREKDSAIPSPRRP